MRSVAIVVALVFIAACSGNAQHTLPTPSTTTSAAHPVATTGTIVGRMDATSGHHLPDDSGIKGEVAITPVGGHVALAKVATNGGGQFRITVPVGNYELVGTSPSFVGSLTSGVSVRSGATVTVSLTLHTT